jgi:hypothetical protein
MKIFAIKNSRAEKYLSDITKKEFLFTKRFQYARMYKRRADASRVANWLNAKEGRRIFKLIEIEITETLPGKRYGKR